MKREALIETTKTFLRGVYFTVLGMVGTFLVSLTANTDLINTVINIGGVFLPVGVVIVTALTALVKLIDRYVHSNQGIERNGIAPKVLQS